jgi:Homeodomain-like domain/Integrase core domain
MDPTHELAQLRLGFVDPLPGRYEVIRPLVLLGDGTITQRAHETRPDPKAVRQEVDRLKTLYGGFHYRELARILSRKFRTRITDKTAKQLWQRSPVMPQELLPLQTYHTAADRAQARLQVIQLYAQGWEKRSISSVLRVSRPTVDRWLQRFEAEHFAGLRERSRAPKAPARKGWLPLMMHVYELQKTHPDAGEFRIWSLLARSDLSVRTIGRIMALNRQVYEDIPHHRRPRAQKPPQPHPYKATRPHQYWFIDGREMDFALDGLKWWSLLLLEGYSRTILAGAIAPAEATGAALMVLYTACLRYGVPETLISDSGGAFTSNAFEAVCKRLHIHHEPSKSSQGASYKNLIETHFNIQRRLYDYQFSLTHTPTELDEVHQRFMHTYNTTAHQGLLHDGFDPPIPSAVLGAATGRWYSPDELVRKFSRAVFPRTTNRYGCVTLQHYHFSVAEGLPQTPVLLWVYGEELRAIFEHVVLAAYACRYDWQTRQVTDIHGGVWYATRFASPQQSLLPLTAQDCLVIYHPPLPRGRIPSRSSTQQLLLFAPGNSGEGRSA